MTGYGRWTVPNLLSASRIALAPVLLCLALLSQREAFLWVLAAAFLTDALDGTVARLTGQVSRFGAVLDSWADVTIYATVAFSMALLWPELLRSESLAIGAVVAGFVLPTLVGFLRFGQFTSYHTWLVKLAAVATALGLFLMLLGVSPWPFRVAAMLAVIAGLEEVIISLLLREPSSDIKGIWTVLSNRRSSGRGG